jgi:tartrate dehydratase alpha subunit/fumarate hydratase class I-like protein
MPVREIQTEKITDTVKQLCIEANTLLGDDVIKAIEKGYEIEESPVGKDILSQLPYVRIRAWRSCSWKWARMCMW